MILFPALACDLWAVFLPTAEHVPCKPLNSIRTSGCCHNLPMSGFERAETLTPRIWQLFLSPPSINFSSVPWFLLNQFFSFHTPWPPANPFSGALMCWWFSHCLWTIQDGSAWACPKGKPWLKCVVMEGRSWGMDLPAKTWGRDGFYQCQSGCVGSPV